MVSRRVFLLLMGGLLAGCGLAGDEPDYTVVIRRDGSFEPASLTVPAGSLIAWHNRGDTVHTITTDPAQSAFAQSVLLPANAVPFSSEGIFPGERWMTRLETLGRYVYSSRYALTAEMIGAITVVG